MVFLTRMLKNGRRVRSSRGKFIDSLRIYVRGGAGGMGFPKYGGIGGKGGSVIVVAKEGVTLKSLITRNPTKRFIAENGGNSHKNRILGEPGADITIQVPPGVTVWNDFGQVLVTTVMPNIGVLEYSDHRQITMADLPGLIEGAHMNIGMGHSFLKHVERTKLLLLVADIQGFQLGPQFPNRSCLDTVVLLNKELELYQDDLLDKPAMLVINKMDVTEAQFKYDEVKDKLRHLADVVGEYPEELRPERVLNFTEVIAISADKDTRGVEKLKHRIRDELDFHAALQKKDLETEVIATLRAQMNPKGPQML
ncbi:GTP-binding protein 10 homolog isoform X3 [Zootermopsis nevadensis]|uniref:GTP-binding protein 10 homolog isoform X3 n=1 Tax=Zootermopsis nevadensis TaxID=136037 RepID=UPI000B8E5869|nr:GTP-binding protein 10 homolog isoform X3 [Zootermopsis nevadensis]